MRRITRFFPIFVLIILNIVLVFTLFKNRQNINLRFNELKTFIQIERDYYDILKQRMFLSHKYESDSLHNDFLKDINQYFLVLRYPKLACTTCMDSLLHFISYNFTEKELNNIILLADGSHEQYITQFKRVLNVNFPRIIETNEDMQVLPLDSLGLPYFFILYNNKCINVFIPEKDKPLETKEYIGLIRQKFFHKELL